jgi:hypothetical protein
MEADSFRHTQICVYLVGLSLTSVIFYDSAKVRSPGVGRARKERGRRGAREKREVDGARNPCR